MANQDDLQGKVIPCVENEYFNKLKFRKSTIRLITKIDSKEDIFIRTAEYFHQRGFKVLQVITEDCSIINNIKEKYQELKIIGGGNINSIRKANEFIQSKSDYLVVGRLFANNPYLIKSWVKLYGKRLIVAINDKKGFLASNKNVSTDTFSMLLEKEKVKNVIYVSEETKLKNIINVKGFRDVRSIISNAIVIYSGGVSSLKDVITLKEAGANSIIVGTALYDMHLNYFGK